MEIVDDLENVKILENLENLEISGKFYKCGGSTNRKYGKCENLEICEKPGNLRKMNNMEILQSKHLKCVKMVETSENLENLENLGKMWKPLGSFDNCENLGKLVTDTLKS